MQRLQLQHRGVLWRMALAAAAHAGIRRRDDALCLRRQHRGMSEDRPQRNHCLVKHVGVLCGRARFQKRVGGLVGGSAGWPGG
eukprot:119771-Chlamydomonas_euryale.AAC.1